MTFDHLGAPPVCHTSSAHWAEVKMNENTSTIDVKVVPSGVAAPKQRRPSHEQVSACRQHAEQVAIQPDQLDMLKELFALADADGSGAIDVDELSELLSKFGDSATREEVQDMMQTVDDDNNGTISFDELCLLMGPRLKDVGSRDDLKLAFDYIDVDGSGGVSQEEIKGLLKKLNMAESMPDEKLAELFRDVDSDGAGEIGVEAFVQLFTNGGLANKELKLAINLLCTVQSFSKSVQAVTGFALWGAEKKPKAHASTVFVLDAVCAKLADRVPLLRAVASLNGTMPGFAQYCSQRRATRWVDAFFRGAGQVVFANNPLSGALILAVRQPRSPQTGHPPLRCIPVCRKRVRRGGAGTLLSCRR